MFFLCTLFTMVEQSSFNKNFESEIEIESEISRGKVTNFSEVTKFIPDKIFSDENFPNFFSPIRYLKSFLCLTALRLFPGWHEQIKII